MSWLPVIHDMGLIQGVLQPAFSGFPALLMSPAAFLQRPARWLRAISAAGATISGGPNFAYEFCVRRVTAAEREGLDLRRWRLAFNGAEPIRQSTLDAFHDMFAPSWLRRGRLPALLRARGGDTPRLHRARRTTSCGFPAPGTNIRIVDPQTLRPCADDGSGRDLGCRPGVAAGYWNQPEETASIFGARVAGTGEGPFLRTGDLGSMRPDGLHITGRIKDILIIRGIKHFPRTSKARSSALRHRCAPVAARSLRCREGR